MQAIEDESNPRVETLAAVAVADPTGDGRLLAKRCGLAVRRELGNPRRSEANHILVVQRVNAWLNESCPSLRRTHKDMVAAKAVVVALTPSESEVLVAEALFSVDANKAENYVRDPVRKVRARSWLQALWWMSWSKRVNLCPKW
jgi:hypothetical protein